MSAEAVQRSYLRVQFAVFNSSETMFLSLLRECMHWCEILA